MATLRFFGGGFSGFEKGPTVLCWRVECVGVLKGALNVGNLQELATN